MFLAVAPWGTSFNPRSPRGERLLLQTGPYQFRVVSIHAPRAGSDHWQTAGQGAVLPVSIHAPRAGSDTPGPGSLSTPTRFQSTLPARGATRPGVAGYDRNRVSIHAPRAGSDSQGLFEHVCPLVSIHAPRAGSDYIVTANRHCTRLFQSTLPARGATYEPPVFGYDRQFQSTLPARGATRRLSVPGRRSPVSIHAPRAGSDFWIVSALLRPSSFNPRSPRGERRATNNS